ncbi:MAG: DUF3299 domain-containing protein [Paracoccaceae bacterium]
MTPTITRRGLMLGAGASALAIGRARAAAEPIELAWEDLIPGGRDPMRQTFQDLGLNDAGKLLGLVDEQSLAAVTRAYDGKRVRLPGYMVPMGYDGTGVSDFLLVPYVGACIHVPPPPPNQIVMVTATAPYEVSGYFEPIWVTGTMQTQSVETELAEVGYVIADGEVAPYEI